MRYTLALAARACESRNIKIGIQAHQQYSTAPDGLDRIYKLVKSPAIGINFDTGNAYLGGQDPYQWLARICDHLVHLHAKDISVNQSTDERGKVTGTPVGCPCAPVSSTERKSSRSSDRWIARSASASSAERSTRRRPARST